MSDFDQVEREHIIQGIQDLEEKGYPNGFGPSSTYDVVFGGKKYPPKAVMAYANYHASGRKIERYFKGGLGTDCFKALARNGFEIKPKGKSLIDTYLEEFAEIADKWFAKEDWFIDRYEFYTDFFTKESIENAEWEDFQELGNHMHSFQSLAIARGNALGKPNLPIEEYRKIFQYIISKRDPINVVINNTFKKYNGDYWLPFFGESAISEIIAYAYADEYVIYNRRDIEALKILGLDLKKIRGEKFGDRFLRYNQLLQPILEKYEEIVGKRTETTLPLELDQFFSWLYMNKKADQPIKDLLQKYKERLKEKGLENEKYKWEYINTYQGKPDLDKDMLEEIKALPFNNLYYRMAGACAKAIAQSFPEEFKSEFKRLRNDELDLIDRINVFNKNTFKLYKKAGHDNSHHQDERTISAYLTLHDPEIYTFYKASYYTEYCKHIGEKKVKARQRYTHYLELLEDLAENYVSQDKELLNLAQEELGALMEVDPSYLLLSQDMLYQMFDQDGIEENETDIIEEPQAEYKISSEKMKTPLNQILFGPPGTGKTYQTIDLAVKIAEPEKSGLHKENKAVFDQLVKDGRIVFTTFHQSMSYEDFIEGIKPKLDEESEDTKYTIEDGIFKKIAQNARSISASESKVDWDKPNYFKMSIGGKTRIDIHNWCIENNQIGLGWGQDKDLTPLKDIGDWYKYRDQFNKLFPDLVEQSRFHIQACYAFQHSMQENDIVVITKGNYIIDAIGIIKGEYYYDDSKPIDYYHFREVEWVTKDMNVGPEKFFEKNISMMAIYQFDKPDLKIEAFKAITASKQKANDEPYILVIDEINRGNVSQVFGELITLIEEDKREGAENEIKVKLPYSKDLEPPFSVPKNLYIIGTMNTADRSVEALDSALRRRFSFVEVMPDPSLLEDIEFGNYRLSEILGAINERIEILIDRDHTIGHSYFMKLKESTNIESDLRRVFRDKIIPLLQEYFFNDYGKIQLVLGKGFVEDEGKHKVSFASNNTGIDISDYEDKKIYRILDPIDLDEALDMLMDNPTSENAEA